MGNGNERLAGCSTLYNYFGTSYSQGNTCTVKTESKMAARGNEAYTETVFSFLKETGVGKVKARFWTLGSPGFPYASVCQCFLMGLWLRLSLDGFLVRFPTTGYGFFPLFLPSFPSSFPLSLFV